MVVYQYMELRLWAHVIDPVSLQISSHHHSEVKE